MWHVPTAHTGGTFTEKASEILNTSASSLSSRTNFRQSKARPFKVHPTYVKSENISRPIAVTNHIESLSFLCAFHSIFWKNTDTNTNTDTKPLLQSQPLMTNREL